MNIGFHERVTLTLYVRKEGITVLAISNDEKKALLKKFPDVYIRRTMVHDSKRHHYYVEESFAVNAALRNMRGAELSARVR